MRHMLHIVKINLINGLRRDTVYFAENWSNVLSTLLYTVMEILLIEFLFGRITSIAGFSKNEVYFLLLIGQLQFYIIGGLSFTPAANITVKIGQGMLDFALTKPVPIRLFMYTNEMSLVRTVRDAVPPLIPVILIVNWSDLSFTPSTIFAGVFIFICGLWLDHALVFTLMVINMWTGSSSPFILNYFWAEHIETKLPFEATFYWFRAIALVLLPAIIGTSLAVSVMLGKSNALFWGILVATATIISVGITQILWQRALKAYSSASS